MPIADETYPLNGLKGPKSAERCQGSARIDFLLWDLFKISFFQPRLLFVYAIGQRH